MRHILVLNAGSTSEKLALFALPEGAAGVGAAAWQAAIDWPGPGATATLTVSSGGARTEREITATDRTDLLAQALRAAWEEPGAVLRGPQDIGVAGHRVVHGGEMVAPALVDDAVRAAIARLAEFAPEHNPLSLEGIAVAARLLPGVPQVAVFDTAFHHTLPAPAAVVPIPAEWRELGIRRYGFHGISHQAAAVRAAAILGRPLETLDLITCHLGGGCSLAAVHRGQSVETTMGFTPLEGLMMATRSGSLDPGVVLYLIQRGQPAEDVRRQLNERSGLLGVSGVSGDVRRVLDALAGGNPAAHLAYQAFIHRLAAGIGQMYAALGRLDAIVFTGGIGEHMAAVRADALVPWSVLGVRLDAERNAAGTEDRVISQDDAETAVLVVRAREQEAIAAAAAPFARR